jgi:hypothetical protein
MSYELKLQSGSDKTANLNVPPLVRLQLHLPVAYR